MNIFDFMGAHPFLTFFLVLIFGDVIVKTIAAIRGHNDNCCCDNKECLKCKPVTKTNVKL